MPDVGLDVKLGAITDYYGVGTVWDKMSITGLSAQEINAMYDRLPASSFKVDVSPSGKVLGRSYTNPFELPVTPGTDFDSNIPGGTYSGGNTFSGNVPVNVTTDPSTGLPVSQTGGSYNPTAGSIVPTVVDRVSLAVTGVNLGAKLGMKIAEGLYNSDPTWWDTHLPGMNPQTWNSLVGLNPVGDFFLRTLFGINGNSMTGYVSEEAMAYYYQLMRDAGFFDDGGAIAIPSSAYTNPFGGNNIQLVTGDSILLLINAGNYNYEYNKGGAEYMVLVLRGTNLEIQFIGRSSFSYTFSQVKKSDGSKYTQTVTATSIRSSITGNTYYNSSQVFAYQYVGNKAILEPKLNTGNSSSSNTALLVFDGTIETIGGHEGVTPIPNATAYPPTNITGTTPQQVLDQLKQQYPHLFDDSITETVLQPDGSTTETTYVPIPWVTTGTDTESPTTGDGKTQTDTDVDQQTGDQILPTSPTDTPTEPPTTGDGDTPVSPVPTGSASSLWAVYNPSQAQLDSFGAWLWSSNFVDQLKKLFNDPMQAIIGVHKVFATPPTGGSRNIVCGYLDSGVSASVVTSQYTSVDCGSASLREYFGNVFDYDPFTRVSIFLPFIGIVPLNTYDVMRSTISVKYRIDVITGACLAEVYVNRDEAGGILYTYSGSAIVTYPISSGSYVGVIQAALSTALGVGATIATGGATAPMLAGSVLGGISSAKTRVQHSGQFSGSSGAMGGKKPYLIISRPQTHTPSNVNRYLGLPSNTIDRIGNYTGFIRAKDVHFESSKAYRDEISEIEGLLKTGIIIGGGIV